MECCLFCRKSIPPENHNVQNTAKVNKFRATLSRLLGCESSNVKETLMLSDSSYGSCKHCEILTTQFSDLYHEIKCLELHLFGKLEILGKVMKLADGTFNTFDPDFKSFGLLRTEILKNCNDGIKLSRYEPRILLKRLDKIVLPQKNKDNGSDEVASDIEMKLTTSTRNVTTGGASLSGKILMGGNTHSGFSADGNSEEWITADGGQPTNSNNELDPLDTSGSLIVPFSIVEKVEVSSDSNLLLQEDEDDDDGHGHIKSTSHVPLLDHRLRENRHKKGQPLTCPKCGKSFKIKKSFRFHLEFHKRPDEWKYKCGICGKKCAIKIYLDSHMATHKTDRPWKCDHANCGKDFKTKVNLRNHLKSHRDRNLDELKFQCSFCERKCPTQSILNTHLLTHAKHRPWKCGECGKDFKSAKHLKLHSIYHKNPDEWKFGCETCGKRFAIKSSLTIHESVHSEERRYECKFCGEKYKGRQGWKKHVLTKHGQEDDKTLT